ncbi:unnamed protein product [Darwinula stevensoni]|uniref:3-oxo-5alpha-steroid 4-dehydrogenase (NADP(+)) n=1 Tax=Darwinula stevensoni TaxID=69355 RepID=A0A7R8X3A1_9CRUS|nr:unnamed protein product [Darwinula stevensoni]CAG0882136.1 unnamed protein product [Darwinula stevensoni]
MKTVTEPNYNNSSLTPREGTENETSRTLTPLPPPPQKSRMPGTELQDRVNLLSEIMLAYAGVMFLSSLFMRAPYGRYTSTRYGKLTIPSNLAWFIQESSCFFTALYVLLTTLRRSIPSVNKVLLFMFFAHYFQRGFVYPYLMKKSQEHPLFITLNAVLFCVYHGYLQAFYLVEAATYPAHHFYTPQFLLGSALFLIGMGTNMHSDHLLRSLRGSGESGYKIPRGGIFEYVSAGNYFGELLEWWGFALASWFSLPALSFAVFVALFLIPRGMHHHKFYQEKFEDYPKNRKAIIPFIL